ncbi:PI-PLC X domain-containing protein At5g67130-like [Triticum aestivum]|uniref:PI-PLC X domain-containing protein At5g67130-like n=1 Tax=Triticum aestivum TaxID=4565 RepID=UPI001D00607B|nr:PI-PLC X domain-containing protein At5g67130-like [Triticum aestivum]XP_044432592.1 PI-PLC X domain-containing protein At5g67130-like [Triticum aestivum]
MFRIICKAFDVGDIAISWLICKLHLQHIPILISIQICKLRSGKSASHRLFIAVKNAIASFSWLTCKLGVAMSADNSPPAPAKDGSAGLSDFLTGMLFILLLAAYFMVFIIMMVGDRCNSDANCKSGLSCRKWTGTGCNRKRCVRTTVASPFDTVDNSLPFNKYAFLTTHNSFSITDIPTFTLFNQEDSVNDQLNNGVRALMLDLYDFREDIWLCHSYGGTCKDATAFEPAIGTMREIEAFLVMNPSEVVTLILEDYVKSHRGLSKLFIKTGLTKYWFPASRMPQNGEDWPRVSDMIRLNRRLVVFTSNRFKESSEGIAYQWNYMVENMYGDVGMDSRVCRNRSESAVLSDRSKSLVLVNYFRSRPVQGSTCMEHSRGLVEVLHTCHAAAGNRWANFLAVDYKRSNGGGVFQAVDMLNGMLICGHDDVHACSGWTSPPLFLFPFLRGLFLKPAAYLWRAVLL